MGLADLLSGTPDDLNGQQALGLAAGLMSGRGGPAFAAGIQNMQQAKKDWQDRQIEQLKMQMAQAQFMQQMRQQGLANDFLSRALNGDQGASASQSAPVPAAAAPQVPAAAGPGAGVSGLPVPSALAAGGSAAPAGMLGLNRNAIAGGVIAGLPGMSELGKAIVAGNQVPEEVRVATALGIPLDQVRAAKQRELAGKGIVMGANGQALAPGVDAQGNPIVTAPKGALEAYQAYMDAAEKAKANNEMVNVNLPGPNGTTISRQMTRAQALQMSENGGAAPQAGSTQASGVDGLDTNTISPAMLSFLAKTDPQAMAKGMQVFQKTGGVPGLASNSQNEPSTANNLPGFATQTPEAAAAAQKAVDLQFAPQQAYANDAAKNFAEKGKALSNQVAEAQEMLARIAQSRQALQTFQAGGGMEQRANIAKALQGLGAPASIVDGVAGGSLSGVQQFQKYAAQEALQTMRQTLDRDDGKGSPGNKAAMQVFFAQNPNIDTDPRATEAIFNFLTKQHNKLLDEQDNYVKYAADKSNPIDVTAFDNYWAHQAIKKGYVSPQIVNGQALGSTPYSATVNLPGGGTKTYSFPDAKSLANFKLEAGIK